MQRVEPTVGLKTEISHIKTPQFPLLRVIAICFFIAILFRLVTFGVTSVLGLIPQLQFLTDIARGINNLTYLVAVPAAVAFYIWLTSSEQESLVIETINSLFRKRSAVIGTIIISSLILMADFAP